MPDVIYILFLNALVVIYICLNTLSSIARRALYTPVLFCRRCPDVIYIVIYK